MTGPQPNGYPADPVDLSRRVCSCDRWTPVELSWLDLGRDGA